MIKIKILFLIILIILILIPIIFFNFKPNSVSEIDNRKLSEFNINSSDKTEMIDAYIKDRVGLRTEAINLNTRLNDIIFGEMIHPNYTYGKDGYVFFKLNSETVDTEFLEEFCSYLSRIQEYCQERDVPFIYCINPSKITVYQEYLPDSYHCNEKFLTSLRKKLEDYNINYIDNTDLLKEKAKSEQVFNVKYDAGHWNDLGAFYGTNNILKKVQEYFPEVQLNTLQEFTITYPVATSLPASHFPINEAYPLFNNRANSIKSNIDGYDTLILNKQHDYKNYLINTDATNNLPKVLFFQGSYMNGREKFLESNFREYIAIHNYENLLNFDYYFNIFQPDCVIVETAEYATNSSYFNLQAMKDKTLNESLILTEDDGINLKDIKYEIKEDYNLITLQFENTYNATKGYCVINDKQFDLNVSNKTISCTFDKKYFLSQDVKLYLY